MNIKMLAIGMMRKIWKFKVGQRNVVEFIG